GVVDTGRVMLRPSIIQDDDMGPLYGENWRAWPMPDGSTRDQITELVSELKSNPDSRRMVVSSWNPGTMDEAALPACHTMFQCVVVDWKLSLGLYQRSGDMFLGVPFNITSCALLAHMLAAQAGLEAAEFVWMGGDCHIYDNHREQVET